MLLVIGEGLPPQVNGYIRTLLVEVAPHTFVGVVTMRVRTQLVAYIRKHMGAFGACTVVYTTTTPQGYHSHTYGNTRLQCVDLDGLQVMAQRRNNGQFDPPERELLDAMAGTPD